MQLLFLQSEDCLLRDIVKMKPNVLISWTFFKEFCHKNSKKM